MCPADDPSALNNHDTVTSAHGCQPVSNDDDRPAPRHFTHVGLNDLLALVVECAGRFIEYQNARSRDQRPGDSDPLTLPRRKVSSALFDKRVIAEWEIADKLVSACEPCCGDYRIPREPRTCQCNVVVYGAIEEEVFLKHDTNLTPQPGCVDCAASMPSMKNVAPLWAIKPLNELCQRRLSRARGADDADNLSRSNVEVDALEGEWTIRSIPKIDIGELDGSSNSRETATCEGRCFGGASQDIPEAIERNLHLLEVLPKLRYRRMGAVA